MTQRIDRRTFMRGAGVAIALPMLEAMPVQATRGSAAPVKRLVCATNGFGMYRDAFFPKKPGPGYVMPKLLKSFEAVRKDVTVLSNLDHGLSGGHECTPTLLTGIHLKHAHRFPEGNVSLDQKAAEFVGAATRFPSIQCGAGGGPAISWTRSGVSRPPRDAARTFEALFLEGSKEEKQKLAHDLKVNRSILDTVNSQAKSIRRTLGPSDQRKLDEYLTAIRNLEKTFVMSQGWLDKPKPRVDQEAPPSIKSITSLEIQYDLIALALQTDSTRIATLSADTATADFNLKYSYHKYSHHGHVPELVTGLLTIEGYQMDQLARFIGKLKALDDPINGGSLLDHTMILFGTGMATGGHSTKNLPLLLAGGGFKHGEHKVYPEETRKRVPASNLLLSMLLNFGVETDRFGQSTGTLPGLEKA